MFVSGLQNFKNNTNLHTLHKGYLNAQTIHITSSLLNVESHLSHTLFMSFYEFCTILLAILYDASVPCPLGFWTCTASFALGLLLLSRLFSIGLYSVCSSLRHADVMGQFRI